MRATDIPDHRYGYEYQDVPSIPWLGDNYTDPDTEPMPQLDEAIEIVRALLRLSVSRSLIHPGKLVCLGCNAFVTPDSHGGQCVVRKADEWLARHTNDESSDLPW